MWYWSVFLEVLGIAPNENAIQPLPPSRTPVCVSARQLSRSQEPTRNGTMRETGASLPSKFTRRCPWLKVWCSAGRMALSFTSYGALDDLFVNMLFFPYKCVSTPAKTMPKQFGISSAERRSDFTKLHQYWTGFLREYSRTTQTCTDLFHAASTEPSIPHLNGN